jgi:hypothetical protein
MVGCYENKENLLVWLRRIEGQVRGIQRMVEQDTYCIDILTQITAITGTLDKVAVPAGGPSRASRRGQHRRWPGRRGEGRRGDSGRPATLASVTS